MNHESQLHALDTHRVKVFLPAYELTAGRVFDFFYMDKGVRYDLAAVFTNTGDLAFVATTILGMYAGTPPGCSELLQSFLKSHPPFEPGRARFPVTQLPTVNGGRLSGKSYVINTAFQEKLVLFTERACVYAAQHFNEGMMDWQCCIDHGHAQCQASAEALVNVRRAHALGAISGIYQVIRDAFKPVIPPVAFPYDPAAEITAIARFKPDNAPHGAERQLTAYDFDYGGPQSGCKTDCTTPVVSKFTRTKLIRKSRK